MTAPTPPPPPVEPPAAAWPPPPPPPPPPPAPAARPPLRRSATDRVAGGVAGGLAEYTGIDPLLWRVGFIALTLAGGSGILVYLLLWLLVPAAPGTATGPAPAGSPAAVDRGPRSPVPGITVAGVLITVGALVLLTRYTSFDVGPRGFLGAALVVVGAGLVVAAFRGGRGSRAGLVVLGLVLSAALVAVTSAPFRNAPDGIGDRTYRPATVADVRDAYRGGVGDMTLDLTRVPLAGLTGPVTTQVQHGIGDVEVLVPRSADVRIEVSHGIGSVDVFGESSDGGTYPGTGSAAWTGDDRPEFVITIDGGIGDVEVDRA